jgi:hypothetical protein
MRVGELLKICNNKFVTVTFQREDASFMGCYVSELTNEDLQTEFKSFQFEYVVGRPAILFNV